METFIGSTIKVKKICSSGKRKYLDEVSAAIRAEYQSGEYRVNMYVYQCRECHFFHLTKRPQKNITNKFK